jgi:hypothetical protein
MKKRLLIEEEIEDIFYVMNDYAQYFIGFKYGKGHFGDNFDLARQLTNDAQFKMLQVLSDCPIEKIYI